MREAFLVLLIHLGGALLCQDVSIEAIYPCRVSFNQDSTCSFQNCYTESPGNPQNQTDWNVCFTSCCPGFLIPSSSVRDSLLRCYDQYLSIPSLVPAIGGILAAIAFLICVVIPCCIHSECPLYKVRKNCCKQNQLRDEGEIRRLRMYEQEQLEQAIQKNEQVKKLAFQNIEELLKVKEDLNFDGNRSCLVCGKERADCQTNCSHCYHLSCLTHSRHQSCPQCHKKEYLPLKYYCSTCFKKYQLHSSPIYTTQKFKCPSCQKA